MTVESVFRGRVLDVRVESTTRADGTRFELEIVRHPGGAGALAIDADERVCLLRQYRHSVADWVWEIPAGRIDPGEAPLQTARRELREEAGLSEGDWTSLGTTLPTPGFCDEEIHLFLVRQPIHGVPEQEPDECIEIHWLDLDDAVARALDGRIRDAKTIIALMRAQHAWLHRTD